MAPTMNVWLDPPRSSAGLYTSLQARVQLNVVTNAQQPDAMPSCRAGQQLDRYRAWELF